MCNLLAQRDSCISCLVQSVAPTPYQNLTISAKKLSQSLRIRSWFCAKGHHRCILLLLMGPGRECRTCILIRVQFPWHFVSRRMLQSQNISGIYVLRLNHDLSTYWGEIVVARLNKLVMSYKYLTVPWSSRYWAVWLTCYFIFIVSTNEYALLFKIHRHLASVLVQCSTAVVVIGLLP